MPSYNRQFWEDSLQTFDFVSTKEKNKIRHFGEVRHRIVQH